MSRENGMMGKNETREKKNTFHGFCVSCKGTTTIFQCFLKCSQGSTILLFISLEIFTNPSNNCGEY